VGTVPVARTTWARNCFTARDVLQLKENLSGPREFVQSTPALRRRGANYCGDCAKFPCDQFMSHCDPNNPEGQRNALFRAGVLAYRSKHGDKKTLLLVGKLGELKHT